MSSGSLNPISTYAPPFMRAATIWDVVKIQGQTCPGLCTISGFERRWGWDKKRGKGAQGTTPTGVGKPDVTGTLTFIGWTGLHLVQWETFRPLFMYDATKTSINAVSVFHPSLADIGISALLCESISPVRFLPDMSFIVEARMGEFAPPPKAAAVSTPAGATTTTSTAVATDADWDPIRAPTDPQQKKIAALYAQLVGP